MTFAAIGLGAVDNKDLGSCGFGKVGDGIPAILAIDKHQGVIFTQKMGLAVRQPSGEYVSLPVPLTDDSPYQLPHRVGIGFSKVDGMKLLQEAWQYKSIGAIGQEHRDYRRSATGAS